MNTNKATVVFDWSKARVEVELPAASATLTPAQRVMIERIAKRLQEDLEHQLFGTPPAPPKVLVFGRARNGAWSDGC